MTLTAFAFFPDSYCKGFLDLQERDSWLERGIKLRRWRIVFRNQGKLPLGSKIELEYSFPVVKVLSQQRLLEKLKQ